MVVAYIALIFAILATVLAVALPRVRDDAVMRAFKRLERDVDEQWERVETHLGRISRLKRAGGEADKVREIIARESAGSVIPGAGNGGARIITRTQLLGKYRRQR